MTARNHTQPLCIRLHHSPHALEAGKHDRNEDKDVEEDPLEAILTEAFGPFFLGLVVVAGGEEVVLHTRHGRGRGESSRRAGSRLWLPYSA